MSENALNVDDELISRAKSLLRDITKDCFKAVTKDRPYDNIHHSKFYRAMERYFDSIVDRKCDKLIKALSVTRRAEMLNKRLINDHKRHRRDLAKALIVSRQRLNAINKRHREIESKIIELQRFSVISAGYEDIPEPMCMINADGIGIPEVSGIYFVYSGSLIVYVGKSTNLNRRLRLGIHHAIKDGEWVSYIKIDKREIDFVESLYIGLVRPVRNFGLSASHRKYDE